LVVNCSAQYKHENNIRDIKYMGNNLMAAASENRIIVWNIENGEIAKILEFIAYQLFVYSETILLAGHYNNGGIVMWDTSQSYSVF